MEGHLIKYLSGFVTSERLQLFERILNFRTRYLTVVLEDLYQSQNISAVLRTADCFGIQDIHVIENKNTFHVNPDVVRGASNWVSVHRYNSHEVNTPEAIKHLRKEGYRIVVASPHEHDTSLENFDLNQGKAALVFGCERPGLSEWAKSEADEFMKIPMVGFTESLNVSVSAAVSLFYLTHQLRNHSGIDWQLSEGERKGILLNWLRSSIKRVDLLEEKFKEMNFK
jgi:tRNA (guanosine-2'-O-)-methyltransferase